MPRRGQMGVAAEASATVAGLDLLRALGGAGGESVVNERLTAIAEAEADTNARLAEREADVARREADLDQRAARFKQLGDEIFAEVEAAFGPEPGPTGSELGA